MDSLKLQDGSTLYASGQGAMQFHQLGKGVTLHVFVGVATGDFLPLVKEDGERQIREHGRCIFMVDGYEARLVTAEFREGIGEWLRQNNERSFVHLLAHSRLIEMAVSVVNLFSRKPVARAYSKIAEWEAVGKHELGSFQRRPIVLPEGLNLKGASR
jgi:hypothetical protein